jgi:hypothetical protein
MKEEENGQAKGKAVDHLDVFNSLAGEDASPLIGLCCELAERGLGERFEKAWKYLEGLEEKHGLFDPKEGESAFAMVTLACISGGFNHGVIFGRTHKVEDESLSDFLAHIRKDMKESGALPAWA